ncbi:MAG: hypothetical protein JOZ38_03745 [Candidatus Eremiobacteraeota bacterium]|nr:hypothetical protein [Candidatus Eremiobacteraeota bacterium]
MKWIVEFSVTVVTAGENPPDIPYGVEVAAWFTRLMSMVTFSGAAVEVGAAVGVGVAVADPVGVAVGAGVGELDAAGDGGKVGRGSEAVVREAPGVQAASAIRQSVVKEIRIID